jgi:hypothetical protein
MGAGWRLWRLSSLPLANFMADRRLRGIGDVECRALRLDYKYVCMTEFVRWSAYVDMFLYVD